MAMEKAMVLLVMALAAVAVVSYRTPEEAVVARPAPGTPLLVHPR